MAGPVSRSSGRPCTRWLLLAVFAVVERGFATRPMMPVRLFGMRHVAVGNGMLLLSGAIAIAMWYFTSLFLQDVLGYSALGAGLGQTPAAITFLTTARLAAGLLPRTGVRLLVLAGAGGLGRFRLARPGARQQRLHHQRARAYAARRGRHRADLPHPHGRGDRRRSRGRRGDHRRPGQHRQSGGRIGGPGSARDGRDRQDPDRGRRKVPRRRPRGRLRPGLGWRPG